SAAAALARPGLTPGPHPEEHARMRACVSKDGYELRPRLAPSFETLRAARSAPQDEVREKPASNLQQFARIVAKHLGLVGGRELERPDHLHAGFLQRLERRSIGAEDEMVGADCLERAACRWRVIAGRFEIHHF